MPSGVSGPSWEIVKPMKKEVLKLRRDKKKLIQVATTLAKFANEPADLDDQTRYENALSLLAAFKEEIKPKKGRKQR